ncbi:putative uncharacterized protein DDB_G0288537 [Papaver somniferum]|uniref:putative uncharacterized protein DDB_G0288537 n=1 Tax=Papaver somniferum TaxID=3469 RepID=UPI000E7057F3|nr:putative uncharacterized protein DDB_G0288537 [Papaver somniferum]
MSCIEGFRRRFTLSDQMSILDTSLNLRDLLRVRDDHHQDNSTSSINGGGRNSLAGLTLGAVLGCEDINVLNNGSSDESDHNHNQLQLPQPPIRTPSRTLLDIIKDEESGTSYRGLSLEEDNSSIINSNKQQKSWKSFKDRLLLRKAAGLTSSSSNPIVVSDDDCGGMAGEYSSSPVNSGIRRRSSFSVVSPTTTSIVSPAVVTDHVQNDSNEQQGNTVSSTLASSSSEPVVIMRLAAALAAEREEQRQQSVLSSSSSTDPQLQENSTSATVLQVPEEEDDQQVRASNQIQTQSQIQDQTQCLTQNQNQTQTPIQNQNQIQTPIPNENQRGVVVANENQPLRVSLMALLEETVDYNGQDLMDIEDEEGYDQDQAIVVDKVLHGDKEKGSAGMTIEEYKCCVCMIRPKGAAFIPCGHTFCRLCSRKLWVNRGNCPLCNSFILEILDIF